MQINTFGILGAGTLGWKIGLQAAISGFDVLMYDISPTQLEKAKSFQERLVARLVKQGRVEQASAKTALGKIKTTTDANSFAASVDFVSESITEDLPLKQKVWASFSESWKKDILLTTNTSYLLPSQLIDQVPEPAKFCAFHFHDVFEARVVDVMPHPSTSEHVVNDLLALGRRLNQIPVLVKQETSGYIFNAMLMAFLGAAGHLVAGNKADVVAVDRSWMGNMNTPIGPFGMMDQIGLDTVDHVLSGRQDKRSAAFRSVIAPLIEKGHLGVKTGKGFYDYPNPKFAQSDFLS